MEVEVAILGFPSYDPYGFCGRKATLNHVSAWSQFVPNMSTDIRGHAYSAYLHPQEMVRLQLFCCYVAGAT